MLLLLDAEAAQQGGGVALGVPALQFGELFFQLGGADAVFVAEVGFGIQGILFLHYIPQDGVAPHDGFDDRAVVNLKWSCSSTLIRSPGPWVMVP